MKRALSILMALVLLLTSLTGCGGTGDESGSGSTGTEGSGSAQKKLYSTVLLPEAADMKYADDVVVDTEGKDALLTGWSIGDSVSWTLTLPEEGRYRFRFVYSSEPDYPGSIGEITFEAGGEKLDFGRPSFEATEGKYDYKTSELEHDLPAGEILFSLYPELVPEGAGFVNLCRVEVEQLGQDEHQAVENVPLAH